MATIHLSKLKLKPTGQYLLHTVPHPALVFLVSINLTALGLHIGRCTQSWLFCDWFWSFRDLHVFKVQPD